MPTLTPPSDPPHGSTRPDRRSDLVEAARHLHHRGVADGVGVTMLLHGDLVYGCANGFTTSVDDTQYSLMEGPCVTAARSGELIRSDTIADHERRWPSFTPAAAALSLRSVVSTPLLDRDTVIGSLNLYSRSRDGLADLHDDDARQLGTQMEPLVRNTRQLVVAARNSQLLRAARHEGDEIDAAVRWLMRYYVVGTRHARILLTQLAQQDDLTDREAARHVLATRDQEESG